MTGTQISDMDPSASLPDGAVVPFVVPPETPGFNPSLNYIYDLGADLLTRVSYIALAAVNGATLVGTANGSNVETELSVRPTDAELASTDADKGAGQIGYDDASGYATGTTGNWLNIMTATRRPAMNGIFSSGVDQLAALNAFVADSVADGKVIEWGPIDLSIDVVTIGSNGFRGLAIPSNAHWVFHPDTVFRAIPNSSASYTIFNLINAQNVVIEGNDARLIGDRNEHTGGSGEFGQGFRIQGSNDIVVRDLHISDCWGDGWYIGSTDEQAWCERVYLQNISATNCRRNGLSLISVKGFRCIDGRFIDTNGTAPQWGIDIEPNFATDFLEDIEFVRPFTKNNNSHGFGIYLNAMEGSTNPVDIRVIGHGDDGSDSGFAPGRMVNIPGLIEYIDAKLINANGPGIISRGKGANGPRIKIVRPTIVDWNRSGSVSVNLSAAILNYAETTDTGTYALGGMDIIEPDLKLNSGSAATAISCVDLRTTSPAPMKDNRIIRPLDLQNLLCTTSGVKRFTDTARASVRTLGNANENISLSSGAVHYITTTLTTARTYTIFAAHSVGREMTFEIGSADGNQARFLFPTGESLFPDTLGVSNYIYSSTKGARLRVRKMWNTLNYDAETVGFTAGSTLTGGTSGATATILRVLDAGTTGTLYLDNVVGTFQNDETITGSGGGSATANGTLGAEWFVVEKVGTWATA